MLAARGVRVVGGARRTDLVDRIAGVTAVHLDLTDRESIRSAVAEVQSRFGRVDILVNNAGYGEFGSIEETRIDDARLEFEVNVFGLADITRRILPGMRAQGHGRIVNVSSLAGEFSSPLAGWYHASKFALEALSDSLRAETRGFGIRVAVVQPGPVRTPWHEDALARLERASASGPYAAMARTVGAYHRSAQAQPITSDPDLVARVIAHAATTANPRTRYRVGRGSSIAVALSRLPDNVFDAMTRRQFGLDQAVG
jgi:NAD(P)-dependent dehydrogenase (short-subunit alcohol dehydrogenase family)